ncbi:hypothetical protein HLH26_09440 [Gluconacetobacter sp. 1b LMG 1731]|uniref:Uncharacterized protein n=2 Tax=Gluconacetobacter dulcium TaxID=2729096 RepID=A0A7W4NSM2_9PROT|nr:hypothetical protein [Gluconacetobacter dulcium]MBB2164759.1 hypothetical protein [Gluconacetobacter dulcium]
MTHPQTSMNALSRSERLAVHVMRHFMPGGPVGGLSRDETMARLPLSLLSEDYPYLARMLADAAAMMPPGALGLAGIMPFQAPVVTTVEHHLLDAIEIAQNGRVTDLRRALRPLFPEGDIPDRLMAALAMLGACLAGAGYILPRRNTGGADRQWWHEPVSVADWLREVTENEIPSLGAVLARPVDEPPIRAI